LDVVQVLKYTTLFLEILLGLITEIISITNIQHTIVINNIGDNILCEEDIFMIRTIGLAVLKGILSISFWGGLIYLSSIIF